MEPGTSGKVQGIAVTVGGGTPEAQAKIRIRPVTGRPVKKSEEGHLSSPLFYLVRSGLFWIIIVNFHLMQPEIQLKAFES